jgi:hypothetical protein
LLVLGRFLIWCSSRSCSNSSIDPLVLAVVILLLGVACQSLPSVKGNEEEESSILPSEDSKPMGMKKMSAVQEKWLVLSGNEDWFILKGKKNVTGDALLSLEANSQELFYTQVFDTGVGIIISEGGCCIIMNIGDWWSVVVEYSGTAIYSTWYS